MSSTALLSGLITLLIPAIVGITFKWHLDRPTMYQTRYQFIKGFLEDFNLPSATMPTLQLVEGYRALAGAHWRPAAEIRHFIERSQHYPGLIRIHKHAYLYAVKFNTESNCLEWNSLFKYYWARVLILFIGTAAYLDFMFIGVSALIELSDLNLTVHDSAFWYEHIFPGFGLAIVGITAFFHVLKIDQSRLLIKKSKAEVIGE